MPNPHARSSGMQHLGLFTSKKILNISSSPSPPHTPCVSTTTPGPPPSSPSPMDTSSTPDIHSHLKQSTSACSSPHSQHFGPCQQVLPGGGFLDGLYSHLKTRAGGAHVASQITRYVGKYLYSLNAHTVEEGALLDTSPVTPYLEMVQRHGIGSSGILHRILAHKNRLRREVRKRIRWCAARSERIRVQRRDRLFSVGVDRRFKTPQRRRATCSKLAVGEEVVQDPQRLLEIWAAHFQSLGKSKLQCGSEWNGKMDSLEMLSYLDEECLLAVPFSTEEVSIVINRLSEKGSWFRWVYV